METQFSDNEAEIMTAACKDASAAVQLVYGKTAHFVLSVLEVTEEDSDIYAVTNFSSFDFSDNQDACNAVADSLVKASTKRMLNE